MARSRILRRFFLFMAVLALLFTAGIYALLLQGEGIASRGLVTGAATRTPEVVTDPLTGVQSVEISVLSYNVAGLPWPIACGKRSRQVDALKKRIPIACDRAKALQEIGDTLGAMRLRGTEPDIILLQEAFIATAEEIAIRGGYPNRVAGPGRNDYAKRHSDRASAAFLQERDAWRGEKFGKQLSSGLLVASNFPISEAFSTPFYQWECAGFDCLANKGVMLVRVEIPGVPEALEVATTHYNSKASTGVSTKRTLDAHKLQVAATWEFMNGASNYDLPLIWGGDLNMRHSDDRISYFVKRAGDELNEVSSYCLEYPQYCETAIDWRTDEPWYENQDLQGWAEGKRIEVEPVRIEEVFNRPVGGKMPSDHNGLLVRYRLSWPQAEDPAAAETAGDG